MALAMRTGILKRTIMINGNRKVAKMSAVIGFPFVMHVCEFNNYMTCIWTEFKFPQLVLKFVLKY